MIWQLGYAPDPLTRPENWIPASVPGAVQLDIAKSQNWPPYWQGENTKDYRWMEGVWWYYRCSVPVPQPAPGGRVVCTFEGVDYRCEVYVNGVFTLAQEGLYRPFCLDLSDHAGRTVELLVRLDPVPKSRPAPDDRFQANRAFKPPVSYSWDFHPRLVPLGLWKPVRLELLPPQRFLDLSFAHSLTEDLAEVHLRLACVCKCGSDTQLRWTLLHPEGRGETKLFEGRAGERQTLRATLVKPELWWPHDQGAQPLYTHLVQLLDSSGRIIEERRQRTGFRRTRLVMATDQWQAPGPTDFPKTRSHPPITLELNGRPLFARGANWVAPDIFPGAIPQERLASLLRLAKDSHFNLLRCWGGSAVMPESFFELADELGLLVWQEFTLACNKYPDDPAYLEVLDLESKHLIRSLRHHPSLALWCGGNELFNIWSGMDDQSHALRLLNRNCFDLDRDTPFLPTAPVEGMAHGHYVFRDADTGREVWSLFQTARYNAYTEFGVPGAATVETLREILPGTELWPPRPESSWLHHHAFGSWTPQHHLCLETLERYFGPIESLERLVELSHWTQGEGLRGVFEEARRQKPRCSMALAWVFNEPWPTAANLSLVSWPDKPKASLATVAQACRPQLASLRLAKFQWRAGESFDPEVWLLNDAPRPLEAGTLVLQLRTSCWTKELLRWTFDSLEAGKNLQGPSAHLTLPELGADVFELEVSVDEQPALTSVYRLSFRSSEKRQTSERKMNM